MKIRSVTLGTPAEPSAAAAIERAGSHLAVIGSRFADAGLEVQTLRVSLPPLGRLVRSPTELEPFVEQLEQACASAGVGYVALGPLRWAESERPAELAESLAAALAPVDRVFGSIESADAGGTCFDAASAAARVVRRLAESTDHGFGNLRFAALANCPPGIPFFPAAYHEGGPAAFSVALQAADLAVTAFGAAETLTAAEDGLTRALDAELERVERVALSVESELGLAYEGADPTLAPFPDDSESIGAAIEALGVGRFGSPGTLAAAALVTRAVRATRARRCGFAGLMLPVLEDSVLARRAGEGSYGWQELLLYSAVCGLGLDTVPLPGDVGVDELTGMIVDVSTLAVALQKPLTARLFPVPGKRAGELASFDFPFFADAGILSAGGAGSPALVRRGLIGGSP